MAARNHIDLVVKTVRVLEALAQHNGAMTLKRIAAEVGIVKSSTFRILFTLKELGYVEQDVENGPYHLTARTVLLVRKPVGLVRLTAIVRPHLMRLRDRVHESVWLAQRRGRRVVLVDGAEAGHPLRLSFDIGDECPPHATALGKAVAAFVPPPELDLWVRAALPKFTPKTLAGIARIKQELGDVRRLGYALNDEETVPGAFLAGAPVFDANGVVCAAISVSAPKARLSALKRKQLIDEIRRCAQAATDDLAAAAYEWRDSTPAGAARAG